MTSIHLTALYAVFLFSGCYILISGKKHISASRTSILLLLGTGLLVRIFFAVSTTGFGNDIACFSAWADRMFTVGPGEFYSPDIFTDYPPGYMYILYIVGALRALFQIPTYSGMHLLLLKLPAVSCDLACAYLLYKEGCKQTSEQTVFYLTAAYLFNPAIILNSSLWGQVDSVFTLLLLCTCLFLIKGKMLPAYIAFGIGILIKPQTFVFAPMLLAGILDYVFLKDFSWKKFFTNLLQGLSVILGMVLLCLPFGLDKVLPQYVSTLSSYPYAAVNAYNFWGLLGLNWSSQDNIFLFMSYRQWGNLAILLIVVFTFVISLRKRNDNSKYPLLGAFIILTMFVFSVRMHERYMYPGLMLLLLYCIYRPNKSTYLCYAGFSILHFYNTAHVLFHYDPNNYNAKAPVIIATSAGMVLFICFFYYKIAGQLMHPDKAAEIWLQDTEQTRHNSIFDKCFGPLPPLPSAKDIVITRTDLLLMATITLLYSSFALYDLGDHTAPVTAYDMQQGESIILDFGEHQSPATLSYYIAPWHDRTFTLEGKQNLNDTWVASGEITLANVFTWQDITFDNNYRYLKLTLQDYQASILDFTFTDASGTTLQPVNTSEYTALFDENDLHPTGRTFRNSMYFDEIYHARTAYEFINGLQTYENTHPPLGKIFIALGITIFGMNPFGWRIIGTLFGIAMLPFIYLFGKRMTHNTPVAALCCTLFAFDFMHFAQTRLATIDVYITFFVIVMYYFMYRYYRMSFYDKSLSQTLLPLGICGTAMGLGVACKWTGAYAGIGLAMLFFGTIIRRYREYVYASATPQEATNGIPHRVIIQRFLPYTKKTIGFCMLFFVAIPAVIYLLSYIPFVDSSHNGLLSKMLANQTGMLSYHSDLNATHPFSSAWYQWPIMSRPIWYYSNVVKETAEIHIREGISAFGNPLVWWVGIPAFFYTLYLAVTEKRNRTARFLVISYLAQYLPWFFVTRITFIYHYFPSVAFVVYMIAYCVMHLKKKVSNRTFIIAIAFYGIATFLLFLLFLPVLSGQPVDVTYVDKYLRWFDSWILIAN